MPQTLELDEFRQILRGSMGLIVGPSQTLNPNWSTPVAEKLKELFAIDLQGTYLDWGSAAAAKGHSQQDIRDAIRGAISSQHPRHYLCRLPAFDGAHCFLVLWT